MGRRQDAIGPVASQACRGDPRNLREWARKYGCPETRRRGTPGKEITGLQRRRVPLVRSCQRPLRDRSHSCCQFSGLRHAPESRAGSLAAHPHQAQPRVGRTGGARRRREFVGGPQEAGGIGGARGAAFGRPMNGPRPKLTSHHKWHYLLDGKRTVVHRHVRKRPANGREAELSCWHVRHGVRMPPPENAGIFLREVLCTTM